MSNEATVAINVARAFRPPLAESQAIRTDEEIQLPITLVGLDPDFPFDTLSFAIDVGPEHGRLSGIGADRRYTPEVDFVGVDRFTYTVSDGMFTSKPATVTITVQQINDPPVINGPNVAKAGQGFPLMLNFTFADVDMHDSHTVSVDWGDGTVESEGMSTPNGTMSGPILLDMATRGVVPARHVYTGAPGPRTVRTCITDNVILANGAKVPTETSLQTCASTFVTVSAVADVLLELTATTPIGTILQVEARASAAPDDLTPDNRVAAATTVVSPADYVVNSLADTSDADSSDGRCATADGTCTLRAAIEEANARPDRQSIALANHTYLLDKTAATGATTLNRFLSSSAGRVTDAGSATDDGVLTVTDDLILPGVSATTSRLLGAGESRLIAVQAGATVTLSNLSLSAGVAQDDGGGLRNNGGTVQLEDVLVQQNFGLNGAGIANNSGILTLVRSAVVGNKASRNGGGIANSGVMNLVNVTLRDNQLC